MDVVKCLIILLIAHVLGDFYFETKKIKEIKEKKYMGIVMHSLEYLIVSMGVIVPIINKSMVCMALYLSLLHFVFETVKYIAIKNNGKLENLFIWHQGIQILSVILLSYIISKQDFYISLHQFVDALFNAYGIDKMMFLRWILALLYLYKPANILIQSLLSGYKPREKELSELKTNNGAGRKIGILERFIMLMFIAMNQYASLGLVLTAKSIARYDKIAKDEQFAEYYLLGTLLSTACVLICKILLL